MKKIDDIVDLKQKCTGCMACADACPKNCISVITEKDGFKYTEITEEKCIDCGKCYSVCPIINMKKNDRQQHLFAAYSVDAKEQNGGSSGGIFSLLANYFADKGYYICGAAFEGTTLKHRIIKNKQDIKPLLKSKYVQSDTEGIYRQILELIKKGEKVFFCGTPCQVSALVNIVPETLEDNLFTADIICHGVPSQKVFDQYIKALEKKHGGKVTDFSFRIKDNKYKHAHGFSYKVIKNGKTSKVNGIYTQSSFYNAFKNYLIFRNGCYNCGYTTLERVSDITLADFWGIEKYDFKGNVDKGVSMIITNTGLGYDVFNAIEDKVVSKEFPLQYGIDSNHCLTHRTKRPKNRDEIIKEITENGYENAAKKYFGSSIVHKLYWFVPSKARTFIRKIRGN